MFKFSENLILATLYGILYIERGTTTKTYLSTKEPIKMTKTINDLMEYQIIRLIQERMETLADMTGYSSTSIYRITGWSDDSTIHHTLRKIIKTVNYKGVTKEDMIHVYACLEGVMESWEAKGF